MGSFTIWTLIRPHRDGGFLVTVSAIALQSGVRTAPGDFASDRCADLDDARARAARLASALTTAIEKRGEAVISRDTTIDVSDIQPRE